MFFRKFKAKGVKAKLNNIRTLLCVGIAFSVTASAFAGARSRNSANKAEGSSNRVSASTVAASTEREVFVPTVVDVAPGVRRVETLLGPITVYQNGRVVKAEAIEAYGDLQGFLASNARLGTPGFVDPNTGSMVFSDGSRSNSRAEVGASDPDRPAARNAEEYKQDMAWVEDSNGIRFANGVAFPGMGNTAANRNMPGLMGPNNTMIWMDGAVTRP